MNWHKLTTEQYQSLYPLLEDKSLSDLEREFQMVGLLYDLTPQQLDALPLEKYKELRQTLSFLNTPAPAKPVKYIKGRKRTYKVVYNVQKMPFARYSEIKTFAPKNKDTYDKEFIAALHTMTASMVRPGIKVLGLFIPTKYKADKHEDYALDLQSAPFVQLYGVAVFFYHLFSLWTKVSQASMVAELQKMGMTQTEATLYHRDLCSAMDGFTTQSSWPTLKASLWKRLGISPPSTPSMT